MNLPSGETNSNINKSYFFYIFIQNCINDPIGCVLNPIAENPLNPVLLAAIGTRKEGNDGGNGGGNNGGDGGGNNGGNGGGNGEGVAVNGEGVSITINSGGDNNGDGGDGGESGDDGGGDGDDGEH